jgi:glycogen(starch) synthase
MVNRVLMTSDAVGGVWTYAIQLADLLTRAGDTQVTLAVLGPSPTAAQRAEAAKVKALAVHDRPFALEWMPNPWAEVDAAGDWLLELATQCSPDIIHLNGYCHANRCWPAPTIVVGHSCVCSWWHAVHGCAPPREWHHYVDRVRDGLHAADAVIAPSHTMNSALERFYAISWGRVIPNCRSDDTWRPHPKEPFIFAAGRLWDPAKNLAALDIAAASLPWPVYVAGASEEPGGRQRRLVHARTLGPIASDAIAEWMGRAAIYAFPAHYEPFGLSVLEAALSGCALVLGDIPSLRENWSGVARFVSPNDPGELHRIIHDLIASRHEREALGFAARARAAQFTQRKHVQAYRSIYREIVTSHDRVAYPSRAH